MKFPRITAENLNKETIEVPNQLRGDPKLLIVAFQQWQQRLVNSWVPYLESLILKYPDFDFYELPTIRSMNFVYRRFIDGGMRAGIPSRETRGRTITLYIDKESFKESLNIVTEETIYLFLTKQDGEIIWKGEGGFDDEKVPLLEKAIEDYMMR
ncbi:MAG: hypothetical protein JW779_13135 [Candidatus Thorarchaeota archaeon]|nr:hypothetical protein [Candidatus Thorarchaeota archaeon]